MNKTNNKYRAYGYFVMAGFFYVAAAFEVLVGTIPSRTGDPGTAYRNDPGFFWAFIAVESAVGLYHLARGIHKFWQQRQNEPAAVESGQIFTPRTANSITASLAISIGLCFLILPVVEMFKATVYGGIVFKTHQLNLDPMLFWQLLIFHLFVAFLPILGGALLLMFSPKKIQTITV